MQQDAAIESPGISPTPEAPGGGGSMRRTKPLRVALFVAGFPVLSETFVVRQIAGLMELGHEVDIFAEWRAEIGAACQPEVRELKLLERTSFMEMPPESAPWEMPVWPLWGRTWLPGSETSVSNLGRLGRAIPHVVRCFMRAPRLAWRVLSRAEYGFQAGSLSSLYRLSRLSRCPGPYDVIHAHFGPVANSFRFAREWFHAPLVVTFHGYDFTTVPRQQGRDVYEKLFRQVDVVTGNSRFALERVSRLGCPLDCLHRVPMGVDPGRFPFRARRLRQGEPVRLLTVARLVPIKGHEVALAAVALLRQRNLSVHYDIVGEGSQRKTLEQRVMDLGLEGCVRFHPACDGDEVRRWLERSHLFVLPSRSLDGDEEAQGLVLQEAQASGMPVVGANSGGIAEGLLPGTSGLLFTESDPASLAEQLQYLAQHPESWETMGRAGREFVLRHFNFHDLHQRWVEIYDEARRHYEENPRPRRRL